MNNEMILFYLPVLPLAYLLGSFPTAYIMIRLFRKKDIRATGSGNVGALNSYRSSKSVPLALTVLLIDACKGYLPVWLYHLYLPATDSLLLLLIGIGVVVGHSFPVWLGFRGGRGLAVTAGFFLAVDPRVPALWILVWLVYFLLIRKHIIASLVATFLLPLIIFFMQDSYFDKTDLLLILPVSFVIFLKHLERLPEVISGGVSVKKESD
ncbi:MAG TPA: glycerol-3-phosphate acyltransferase [Caldithrix abyssi]|uniref:Glycerol-3-phosphate acyltransferase n=1 Tax=Caldithrix abyssi TaxID=187145 RepID=A0A7V1LQE4_CALAY|nr:glycerol-3-phosphate acyltransferase [Caldithrix abyssi]